MDENKALSMISIAAKAGKVVSGGFLCEKAVQEGSAYLIIIADNAAKNTRKKLNNVKITVSLYLTNTEPSACFASSPCSTTIFLNSKYFIKNLY